MGGCRCSYRNCSVRSDGVTHMFHYPVFEKVRCHQWLTNAHKLEFLNLTVSQLKNRVICQHHFKDDCFMNYMKDKLTFDAVPTLNGPYCDSTQYDANNLEISKLYPISLDDIENEYLTFTDKKANFSVKYGNFLTNFDMIDVVDPIDCIKKTAQTEIQKKINQKFEPQSIDCNDMFQNNNKNEFLLINVDPLSEVPRDNPQSVSRNQLTHDSDNFVTSPALPVVTKSKDLNHSKNRGDKKIKILSETKISEPVRLLGKLEEVSPSFTIRLQDNKNRANVKSSAVNESNSNNEMPVTKILNHITIPIQSKTELPSCEQQTLRVTNDSITEDNQKKKIKISIQGNTISSNSLLSKNKASPEKIAAIREKRKFNMKLKEIIESCLDKFDKPNENDNDNLKTNSNVQNNGNTRVSTFLSEEPELPNLQEYTMACLEARMQKMENLLLSKIDQNSQRIMELKNSISSSSKISKCTQTAKNEELRKRQLYEEISQYLSPNVNSLIYEELFINKSVRYVKKSYPLQRKRKRNDIEEIENNNYYKNI